MLKSIGSRENRREYELLVHIIGYPVSHHASRIIPTSETSTLTEYIDLNPCLSLIRFIKSWKISRLVALEPTDGNKLIPVDTSGRKNSF